MKIFFARHGQYLNPGSIVTSHLPGFTLSELGIKQVGLVADRLKTEKIRTLSTSPIQRCVETATIIGKTLGLHPNQKPALIETATPFQGQKQIDAYEYVYSLPQHVEGGGETVEAIFKRMSSVVADLKSMSQNSNHVIVSHGDPIDIYLVGLLNNQLPRSRDELKEGGIRSIPMGGLVMLEYTKSPTPTYSEII